MCSWVIKTASAPAMISAAPEENEPGSMTMDAPSFSRTTQACSCLVSFIFRPYRAGAPRTREDVAWRVEPEAGDRTAAALLLPAGRTSAIRLVDGRYCKVQLITKTDHRRTVQSRQALTFPCGNGLRRHPRRTAVAGCPAAVLGPAAVRAALWQTPARRPPARRLGARLSALRRAACR